MKLLKQDCFKLLLVCLIVLSSTTNIYSQKSIIDLDRRFVHCINKWVAFGYDDKSKTFAYGYVYLSSSQGISLRYMGTLSYSNGHFIPNNKPDSLGAMMTYRLSPEKHKGRIVGIIPNERLREIGVQEFPDWLKFYRKDDTVSIHSLYNRGFLFNAWEECKDALNYLQKANEINPKFEGLAVELAFSYNCLEQYDKAAEVLRDALKTTPDNCYYYKELVYALKNSKQLKEAEDIAVKGISLCNDNLMKCEMAYNISQIYYEAKDKSNLKKWLNEAKKYPNDNKQMNDGIKVMEAELTK